MHHNGIRNAVLPKGAMDFCGSRFFYDTGRIFWCDTGSGHDAQDATPYTAALAGLKGGGFLYQPLQQGNTILGRGSLTAGKQAVASQGVNLQQGLLGVSADVKGAVEGDVHLLAGSLHHPVAGLYVYVAFGRKSSYHHALCSQLPSHLYVIDHTVHLVFGIYEISLSRSDQNMHVYAAVYRQFNHTGRWGQTVQAQGLTEFYPVCSAGNGGTEAVQVGTAYL